MMNPWARWAVRLVALVLLVLAPRLLSDFRLLLLTQILIFGLLAASLDLLVGYTGLPSLGHATYFGIGGYAAAIVARDLSNNGFWQIGIAVPATAVVAAGTGWLAVRTRGVYFLMLTLAFSQLLFSLAVTWTRVTGGSNGLVGIPKVRLLPGRPLGTEQEFYYYAFVAVLVGYLALRQIAGSPFGRALEGIRENEGRMRAVGYATVPYKLAAFCVAGAVGGYAGALFTQNDRFISPSNVSFEISALALIMVIVGGTRTLYGPVLGAGVVIILRDELSSRFEDRWRLILGLVFIAVVYFLPRGIAGLVVLVERRLGGRALTPNPLSHKGRGGFRVVGADGADDQELLSHKQKADRPDGRLDGEKNREPLSLPGLRGPLDPRGGRGRGAGVRDNHDAAPIVLELVSVSKTFGSLRAVDRVSLTVREGQRHALIGPNGAGKSTLFNMIAGTTSVGAGRILFRGADITRLPEHRRSRLGIGKTFQHSNVFSGLSTLVNVAIPVQQRAGIAHRLVRPAGSYRDVTRQSMALLDLVGLAHRAEELASTLSHGERRQLEVAMALATEPSLLLLDEPTAGLSRAESDAFVRMIEGLPSALTVVVIEHDIDVVLALADRISVLHVGQLLADGTPGEIRASAEVQEAYLGGERTEELFERI